jgi:hypothetical protein
MPRRPRDRARELRAADQTRRLAEVHAAQDEIDANDGDEDADAAPCQAVERRLTAWSGFWLASLRDRRSRIRWSRKRSRHPQRRQAVDTLRRKLTELAFLEVASRHGDLTDAHPARDRLGDQLLVEDEVVAVQAIGDRLQQVAAVGPEAGVVLGKVQPEGQVLVPVRKRLLMYFHRACRPPADRPGSGCRA